MVLLPVISPLHQLERQVEASVPPRPRPLPSTLSRLVLLRSQPRLDRARSLPFRRQLPALKRSHTTRDVVTLVTVSAGDIALIPLRPLSFVSAKLPLFPSKPALLLPRIAPPPPPPPPSAPAMASQPQWTRSFSAPEAPTVANPSANAIPTARYTVDDTMGDMPSIQFDRALVYLFDLVSTLGRLLDRLDLDDDGYDHDVLDDFDYAGEIALIMTTPMASDGAGAVATLSVFTPTKAAPTTLAPPRPANGIIEEDSYIASESSDDDYDSLYATITHPQVTLLRKALGLSLHLVPPTPPRLAKRPPAPVPSLPVPSPPLGRSLAPQRTSAYPAMYTYGAGDTAVGSGYRLPSLLPTIPPPRASPGADKSLAYGIDIPHCVNHDYSAALVRNLALDDGDIPLNINVNANRLLDLFRADTGPPKRLAVHRTRTRTTKALVVQKQLPDAPIAASTHDVATLMAPPLAPALQMRSVSAPSTTGPARNLALLLLRSTQLNPPYRAVSEKPAGLQLPFQQSKSQFTTHRRDKKRLPPTTPPHNALSSKGSPTPHLLTALLTQDMTPEARTKLALQFRNIGKHREALYQLQIAALPPNNFPKAMFLYAMALRFGLGVKQNDRLCIKWLGKCILMFSQPKALADIVDKLNALQPEELVKLIVKKLAYDTQKDPVNNGSDPYQLFDQMSRLSKTDILKIANTSKNQSDILAVAYFELANAVLNGWGLNHKEEAQGIKLLLKSAAMGYVQAMMQLGEIWTTKSKTRKKDLNKAAVWLRLLELFGAKSMGNSWIYKSKYMKRK